METHSSILVWRIPKDRAAWWATVHRVTKSWIQLKWLRTRTRTTHAHFPIRSHAEVLGLELKGNFWGNTVQPITVPLGENGIKMGKEGEGQGRVWSFCGSNRKNKSELFPKECIFGALVDLFCGFFFFHATVYTLPIPGQPHSKVPGCFLPPLAVQWHRKHIALGTKNMKWKIFCFLICTKKIIPTLPPGML